MRTLTATMMALLMVLLAAGCGGEPEGGPESSSRPTEPAMIAAPTAALELPPTATPHPTITPQPTPEPTPTAAPEPTPLPMVMRHGEEMLEAAARALDSGVQLAELELYQEALRKFLEAREIQGKLSRVLELNAGIARAGLGQHPGAVEHFSTAIGLADGAEPRVRRALSLREAGQCPAAIRDAQRALGMTMPGEELPGFNIHAQANLALARCQQDRGGMTQAQLHAHSALRAAQDSGYTAEALRIFQELVRQIEAELAKPVPSPSPTLGPPQEAAPEPTVGATPGGIPPSPPPPPTARPTPGPGGSGGPPPPPLPSGDARKTVRLEDVRNIGWVKRHAPQSFNAIRDFPWVKDGLVLEEIRALEELTSLFTQQGRQKDAEMITLMPLLETIDLGEAEALEALRRLSRDHPRVLRNIMKGPPLTDRMTPMLAVMPGVAENNTALAGRILKPNETVTETRLIRLRGSRDVRLNIIRLKGNAGMPETMNELSAVAIVIHDFMEEPFPVGAINLLFADAVDQNATGGNFKTGIIIKPGTESSAETRGRIMAHEVAHYYWTGNEYWIDEGMAEHLAAITEANWQERHLGTIRYPCAEYRSISEMPARERAHPCDYSLGSRLFLDLDQEAGRHSLQQQMQDIYRASLEKRPQGTGVGIDELRERFAAPEHDEDHSHIHGGETILQWYDGGAEYETDPFDETEARPEIPSPEGRVSKNGGRGERSQKLRLPAGPARRFRQAQDHVQLRGRQRGSRRPAHPDGTGHAAP